MGYMTLFQAIFLGLVQGFTEVLPISSSGHLVLVPWFFDFDDPGLAFDVALHLGTLVAIVAFFRKDVAKYLKGFVKAIWKRELKEKDEKLAFYIILATIPGVILGASLNDYAESSFRNPLLIAFTTFFFGLALLYAEKHGGKMEMKDYDSKKSFLTGLAQAIAIVPGVSRSGITISGSMFQGFTRETAARFSFLISVPIIAGAGLVKVNDIPPSEFSTLPFWAGFITAVIASFASVKFLMNFLRNHKLNIFAYYRFGLALLIVIIYLTR
jgi:undecaprenyl-diphosphatase